LQTNRDRGYRASLDESAAYDTERYDLGVMRLPASLSAALQHFSPPRLPRPTAGEARGRKMRHKQGVPTKIPEQPKKNALTTLGSKAQPHLNTATIPDIKQKNDC